MECAINETSCKYILFFEYGTKKGRGKVVGGGKKG
jgi:hypothetical protein